MTAMPHPSQDSRPRLVVACVALTAAAAVAAVLVLAPTPALPSAVVHRLSRVLVGAGLPWPAATAAADAALNVALFVPWSFLAALLWRRVHWWQWVAVGYLVSASVEGTQWLLLTGRTAQVTDLVSNTAGAAIGAGACFLLVRGGRDPVTGGGASSTGAVRGTAVVTPDEVADGGRQSGHAS